MNTVLFYDTETTGIPLFNEPSEDPRQPHIVQLAACLVDLDTHKTIQSMDVIVRPDGWEIPDDVAAIHGITTEVAKDVGISECLAVEMLLELWRKRTRIGHNEQFDARIIRIALKRYFDDVRDVSGINDIIDVFPSDSWKAGQAECTLKLARPYCKLPSNKAPKLTEAYKHFTGEDMPDAHSAMGDVQGCMAVYFSIHSESE